MFWIGFISGVASVCLFSYLVVSFKPGVLIGKTQALYNQHMSRRSDRVIKKLNDKNARSTSKK